MFERIKGWEDERLFILNNHKNFIDNILISLDKKNGISSQSMQILIKFFTERIQQVNYDMKNLISFIYLKFFFKHIINKLKKIKETEFGIFT